MGLFSALVYYVMHTLVSYTVGEPSCCISYPRDCDLL